MARRKPNATSPRSRTTTRVARPSLGREMLTLYDELTDLIAATADADRKKELRAQQDDLWDQIARLVESNLDAADQKYQAAVVGLNDAIDATRNAIKGLESIINAINLAASAIQLVTKVVPV